MTVVLLHLTPDTWCTCSFVGAIGAQKPAMTGFLDVEGLPGPPAGFGTYLSRPKRVISESARVAAARQALRSSCVPFSCIRRASSVVLACCSASWSCACTGAVSVVESFAHVQGVTHITGRRSASLFKWLSQWCLGRLKGFALASPRLKPYALLRQPGTGQLRASIHLGHTQCMTPGCSTKTEESAWLSGLGGVQAGHERVEDTGYFPTGAQAHQTLQVTLVWYGIAMCMEARRHTAGVHGSTWIHQWPNQASAGW